MLGQNGSWVRREYLGEAGRYQTAGIGQADDYSAADGLQVIDYFQAIERLGSQPLAAPDAGYTVEQAVEEHLRFMRRERKTAADTGSKLHSYVTPYFGDRQVASLTADDFGAWLEWALKHKPQGRRKEQGARPATAAPSAMPAAERTRRKKATLNRVLNALKAALNRAHQQGKVSSDRAWAGVRRFKGADRTRDARLNAEEAMRLINAAPAGFRELVQAALMTGCRYAELAELRAGDFDSRSATVVVQAANAKSSKSRRIPLTAEGAALFESMAAGKPRDARILLRGDGSPWAAGSQHRPMVAALKAAQLPPVITFHALRHSYASLLVEAGTPLAFVAEALGHADTRMVEKHYAHLAPNLIHDAIRANLPAFGMAVDAKVRAIR
ncbi:MAG: site-specific integrase [Steroidobacteraceae bacterium]